MRELVVVPLQTPSPATLKRYGFSYEEWRALADQQAEACFVCLQKPTKGRLCIDHEHVKDWKRMPPEQRRLFVRGLLCFRCNTSFVGRGITVERAERVALYLKNYISRRVDPATLNKPKKSKKAKG